MKNQLHKLVNKETAPFLLLFVLYFILFFGVKIANDDAVLMVEYQNLTWQDHWALIQHDYFNWSSRVLVNFVIHFLLGKPLIIFTFLNAVIAAIFAKTLSQLFNETKSPLVDWFIVCLILLYPLSYLGSAGWVVTMMTYFWPMVFGFVALIPIKKIQTGESFAKWEYVAYATSLIYAANEELKLLVLLLVYGAFFVYFLAKKRLNNVFFFVQLFLLAASLVFTLTTPGNGNRSLSEASFWFPTYGMLDTVDKLDIGFFATMQNVIFDRHIFLLVIAGLLSLNIFRKYDSIFIKLVGLAPTIILLLFGPLKNLDVLQHPWLERMAAGISENGLVTISTGGLFALMKYTIVVGFSFTFALAVVLALENLYKNIFALTLLVSGVGSRVAMGFSPTIYASGFRTATPLFFAIMAIGVMIVSEMLASKLLSKSEQKNLLLGLAALSAFVFVLSVLLTHT